MEKTGIEINTPSIVRAVVYTHQRLLLRFFQLEISCLHFILFFIAHSSHFEKLI